MLVSCYPHVQSQASMRGAETIEEEGCYDAGGKVTGVGLSTLSKALPHMGLDLVFWQDSALV